MEVLVFVSLIATTIITAIAPFVQSPKRMVQVLFLQASAVGFVEQTYCIIKLLTGLTPEALVDFLYAFVEWFVCAAFVPFIIYYGVTRTKCPSTKPALKNIHILSLICALVEIHLILGIFVQPWIPHRMETLILSTLMFNISILTMIVHKDAIKILVGLNMAENSLYPLLVKSPVIFVPIILCAVILVNVVAIFVVIFAYQTYNSIIVTDWR
ncbi:MAG: hypothetical protein QXI32_02055 [Candidatus Bathyarchaeia archaeon]